MSDEAFARRFYSDRAELIALGVPLSSQRDEFTGEELYSLRSERYFLPKLELGDDELAALLTALHLLEGQFAYAEPLRLALQNLALGRGGFDEPPNDTAERVQVVDPEYSPEMAGRLVEARDGDLEAAHRALPLPDDDERRRRRAHAQPVRALPGPGPLVRGRPGPGPRGHPHLPRLADPRRDPLRDAPRARLPHAGRVRHRRLPRPAAVADRRPGRRGADRGAGRHGLVGRAHVRQPRPARGRRLRHRLREPRPARLVGAAAGRARRARRAGASCATPSTPRSGACARRTRPTRRSSPRRPTTSPPTAASSGRRGRSRRSASASSRRCSRTCSPPAARAARRRSPRAT